MKSFIQGKLNPECQNITLNKASTCDHTCDNKLDVISDKAVHKYSKVNDVNTLNCETVKVQLQDSVGSSTMDDDALCSLEITGDEGQNITNNNLGHVPVASLQDMGCLLYTSRCV